MYFVIAALTMLFTLGLWWIPVFAWKDNKSIQRKVGFFLVWVNIPIYYCAIAPAFFEQPRVSLDFFWLLRLLGGLCIVYATALSVWMLIPKIKAGGPGYKPNQLLCKGAFAVVRHPQISAILTLSLGVSLWQGAIYHLLVTIAYLVIFVTHVRMEEHFLLLPLFGEQYREYSKKTASLLPFLF